MIATISKAVQIPSVNPGYPGQDYDEHVGKEGEVARLVAALYEEAERISTLTSLSVGVAGAPVVVDAIRPAEPKPATVEVVGPESALANLTEAITEPVTVEGASGLSYASFAAYMALPAIPLGGSLRRRSRHPAAALFSRQCPILRDHRRGGGGRTRNDLVRSRR